MVTDLSTTGGSISTIEESTAFPTIALSFDSLSGPNQVKFYRNSPDTTTR